MLTQINPVVRVSGLTSVSQSKRTDLFPQRWQNGRASRRFD